jgi:hypothetical protein
MASGEITVTVEVALHNALAELAQHFFDEHGLQLNAAQINWVDTSSVSKDAALVYTVHAETTTLRMRSRG